MHKSSYANMGCFVDKYLDLGKKLRVADIGGQDINGSYKPLFPPDRFDYVCCDVAEGPGVDVVLKNAYRWRELRAGSFDVVISGQAFEHIEYFWVTILEIARILKDNGVCCIIAPSAGVRHRYPVDCWRFYEDGIRALAKYAYLTVLDAYTQSDRLHYVDLDPVWQDSVLICRKPVFTHIQKLKSGVRIWMSRRLVKSLV